MCVCVCLKGYFLVWIFCCNFAELVIFYCLFLFLFLVFVCVCMCISVFVGMYVHACVCVCVCVCVLCYNRFGITFIRSEM